MSHSPGPVGCFGGRLPTATGRSACPRTPRTRTHGVAQRLSLTRLIEVVLPSAAATVTFSVALTLLRGLANLSVSLASPAFSSVLRALPIRLPLTVRVAETVQAPAHGT